MMLLPIESPTISKDTTIIARAHRHGNRERHTRHTWEGLAGMGSIAWTSAVSHVGSTSNAFKVNMKLQTFLFQMVVTSCISVQYLWKHGFAKSSDNLWAPCILRKFEFLWQFFLFPKNTQESNFVKCRPMVAELYHANGRTKWTDSYDESNSRLFTILRLSLKVDFWRFSQLWFLAVLYVCNSSLCKTSA